MTTPRKFNYQEQKSDFLTTFRGAYVEIQPHLRTPLILRLVERNFSHIQYCLYFTSVFAQILLGDSAKQLIDQSENHIMMKMGKAEEEFSAAMARLQHLCQDLGIESSSALYNPTSLTIKVATPLAKRYLALMEKADSLIAMQNYLWIMGMDVLSRSDRFVEEQKIKRLLGSVTRTIRTLYLELKIRANAQPSESIASTSSTQQNFPDHSKAASDETERAELTPLKKNGPNKVTQSPSPDTDLTQGTMLDKTLQHAYSPQQNSN